MHFAKAFILTALSVASIVEAGCYHEGSSWNDRDDLKRIIDYVCNADRHDKLVGWILKGAPKRTACGYRDSGTHILFEVWNNVRDLAINGADCQQGFKTIVDTCHENFGGEMVWVSDINYRLDGEYLLGLIF